MSSNLSITKVHLVNWKDEHTQNTVLWLSDPQLQSDFGVTFPVSSVEHNAWRQRQKDLLAWAIVADTEHVGNLLIFLNQRQRSGYLQLYIGNPMFRGRGLGKLALGLALEHVFSELDFQRIWLHTFPENIRAEHLYQSFGFMLEGCERLAFKNKDGKFVNQHRWSILAEEWFSLRERIASTRKIT
jgi:diamine N-acetyltransferase